MQRTDPVDPFAAGRRLDTRRLRGVLTRTLVVCAWSMASAAPATGSGALAPGSVYRCTLPGIGLFTGAYFGIVDARTYRNFDGKTGNLQFDPATGVLRLTTGPGKGMAYQRQSGGNFRVLDESGKITGGNCVLNPQLSINGRW
jgi:hypothetical protein